MMVEEKPRLSLSNSIKDILDLARWTPSGDNQQEWRFRIISDNEVDILFRGDDPSFLNIDGIASQLAFGALLETISIAASNFGLRVERPKIKEKSTTVPTLHLKFIVDSDVKPSALLGSIKTRSVHRGHYKTRKLTASEKQELQQAAGSNFTITWLEDRAKKQLLKIAMLSEDIRVLAPEMVDAYRKAIRWDTTTCDQGLPSKALGLNPLSAKLFRPLLSDTSLFLFFQKYLGGRFFAKLELDIAPSFMCGANILITAKKRPTTVEDFLEAGAAIQRFWLTATKLGLLHQPNYVPVAMNIYGRDHRSFSKNPTLLSKAVKIREGLVSLLGSTEAADNLVWVGRIGEGTPATSRSLRLPLSELIVP